jgi:phage baseplate assembly protein W
MTAPEAVMASAENNSGIVLLPVSQVRNSIGRLNWCPAGHRIMTLSTGPSLERMVNRYLTTAGASIVRRRRVQVGRAVNEHHLACQPSILERFFNFL